MALKIVHINTNDVAGGAARAAHRLREGLLEIGHDSTMFMSREISHDPTVLQFIPPKDMASSSRENVLGPMGNQP